MSEPNPVAEDLLNAMALLYLERAALRDELGYEPQGRSRTFTKQDLERGATLGPLAFIDDDELVFRLES
jgi:hypothetical protein